MWLSVPWVLSAFLGVITHFLIDEVAAKDDLYFTKKLAAIDLHRIDAKDGKANPDEMLQIVRDTYPDIEQAKKAVDTWSFWSRWFERLTFTSLVVGFIWAIVGPLVLP
jgi:hypothetical protein